MTQLPLGASHSLSGLRDALLDSQKIPQDQRVRYLMPPADSTARYFPALRMALWLSPAQCVHRLTVQFCSISLQVTFCLAFILAKGWGSCCQEFFPAAVEKAQILKEEKKYFWFEFLKKSLRLGKETEFIQVFLYKYTFLPFKVLTSTGLAFPRFL